MAARMDLLHEYTKPYSEEEKLDIWDKGLISSDREPSEWREDELGNLICYDDYGDRDSVFGWEVDHIIPIKDGGNNLRYNLRPLQWEANVKRN